MAALWPGSAAAGSCTGLGAMGPCRGGSGPRERAETRQRPWGSPRRRASPTRERRGTWLLGAHTVSQATSRPLGTAVLGKKVSLLGVCIVLLAKGEREGSSSSIQPSTPAVWLHLRAVTRRKKLRVPVGKSL